MKFKVDENLPVEVAEVLRESGFDTETVWDESLVGASDEVLARCIVSEHRILITLDLDFANIHAYPPKSHEGIIVLRLKAQDKLTVIAHIRRLVIVLKQRNPTGELWIVEHDRIRFRESN